MSSNLPRDKYPSPDFPTIYADGASNLAYGAGVFKFYLARLDPSLDSDGTSQNNPFMQVVVSEKGFLNMAAFFWIH